MLIGTAGLGGAAAPSSGPERPHARVGRSILHSTRAIIKTPLGSHSGGKRSSTEPGDHRPHHHLWDRGGHRYLLDQLLADTGFGHNINANCLYRMRIDVRADGPVDMEEPVGETEFVNGTAAMSASGEYGQARLCAGIVACADLRQGDGVGRILDHPGAVEAAARSEPTLVARFYG
jgi:hypothetical protein